MAQNGRFLFWRMAIKMPNLTSSMCSCTVHVLVKLCSGLDQSEERDELNEIITKLDYHNMEKSKYLEAQAVGRERERVENKDSFIYFFFFRKVMSLSLASTRVNKLMN